MIHPVDVLSKTFEQSRPGTNEWTLLQELACLLPKRWEEWVGGIWTTLAVVASLEVGTALLLYSFEPVWHQRECTLCLVLDPALSLAFERAVHLGDIVKSRRVRGTPEEARFRLSLARSRAACFARPNRRGCSQATLFYKGNNFLATVLSTPLVCLNTTKPQFL